MAQERQTLKQKLRQGGLLAARSREYHRTLSGLRFSPANFVSYRQEFESKLVLFKNNLETAVAGAPHNRQLEKVLGEVKKMEERLGKLKYLPKSMALQLFFPMPTKERREEVRKIGGFFATAIHREFGRRLEKIREIVQTGELPQQSENEISYHVALLHGIISGSKEFADKPNTLNDSVPDDKQFEALLHLVKHGTLESFPHLKQ